jgi:TM2 domain-containing membrane protein YozV
MAEPQPGPYSPDGCWRWDGTRWVLVGPTRDAGWPPTIAPPPRGPLAAMVASFFVPGLGTMLNGEIVRGLGILSGFVTSCFLVLELIGVPGVIGFWVWGLVDAYRSTGRWNRRRGLRP